jgi:hypothetical protein
MPRKKPPKKSKTQNLPASEPEKKSSQVPEPEADEKFDFGGIPDRSLKKNLGCG